MHLEISSILSKSWRRHDNLKWKIAYLSLNFNYRSKRVRNGKVWWVGDDFVDWVVWKLTFVFVYFEVGISSTYIPISTNNILQEILVWVLKWNRLGVFLLLWSNSKFHLSTDKKKHLNWNAKISFYKISLYIYIWFSFFINQFWLYNKTRKKERAKMLCNISSWNSPTPNFLAE